MYNRFCFKCICSGKLAPTCMTASLNITLLVVFRNSHHKGLSLSQFISTRSEKTGLYIQPLFNRPSWRMTILYRSFKLRCFLKTRKLFNLNIHSVTKFNFILEFENSMSSLWTLPVESTARHSFPQQSHWSKKNPTSSEHMSFWSFFLSVGHSGTYDLF